MKKSLKQDLLEALYCTQPEFANGVVKFALETNLDPVISDKKITNLCFCTADEFIIWSDGVIQSRISLESITSFRSFVGVGCVFAEYITNEGETVLFARGDNKKIDAFSRFVKSCNHFLREKQSKRQSSDEVVSLAKAICPHCGNPIPPGKSYCPTCSKSKNQILRLIKMAKPEWFFLCIASLMFLLSTGMGLFIPYLNRIMVDKYIQQDISTVFLWGFVGVVVSIFAANVVNRLIGICRGNVLAIAGSRLIVRLRNMVFHRVQELSVNRLSKYTTGDLMQRVSSDTSRVRNFLLDSLPTVIEQGLLLIAITGLLFWYDPLLAVLILVPAPIVMLALRSFRRFMNRLYRQRADRNAKANAVLHDIFSGIRVVKAYGMEHKEEEHFTQMAKSEMESQLRQEKIWAVLMPILDFFMGFGSFILLYYVGSKMLVGEMTAGQLSQFTSYSYMIYTPLGRLLRFPREFLRMKASLNRIYELVDQPNDMSDQPVSENKPNFAGAITLDHVSFGYEGGDDVLRDVSLQINPGEFVGIVGRSGSGKSTLINLIMRMYDVEDGSIQIDGVDIREISQDDLRSHMGVVLQETYLFAGTIWQNIAYAKPDATRDEVIRAAKIAGAHEFIIRLADGYQTYVGERGYTLSGGERQRISIARALLHDPQILILDEATSALDTETEKWIQDALKELCKGRTTIAIAHRLSTLRNANKLVVIDHGKIAEVGSHEELMQKNGYYASLVLAQREMTKI